MGVKIRKRGGKWYVFVNYHGRRKAKCVGSSRELAEQVRRQLEAKLSLGDFGFLSDSPEEPTFANYAANWLKTDALRCKPSTVDFYRDYQERYVIPRFGQKKITSITRDEIKAFMSDLTEKGLAKNTIRLAIASLRVVLSRGWNLSQQSGPEARTVSCESEGKARGSGNDSRGGADFS